MARKVTPRESYTNDAIALRRIAEAIELDAEADKEWKQSTCQLLHEAMRLLLQRGSVHAVNR